MKHNCGGYSDWDPAALAAAVKHLFVLHLIVRL